MRFIYHRYGFCRAFFGADTASFAVFQIKLWRYRPRDNDVRTEQPADEAGFFISFAGYAQTLIENGTLHPP
jgi:hypothetical protein